MIISLNSDLLFFMIHCCTLISMIESRYWKDDLIKYAKKFKQNQNPPNWSEKRQVKFEKDITIAFFMIRKLSESNKLSKSTEARAFNIFKSPSIIKVNNRNFWDINELYDLNHEKKIQKNLTFICNQIIHGGAIYAFREDDGNWGGLYTCSDREREKYLYRIPLKEIILILELTGNDFPSSYSMVYDENKGDYVIKSQE
jgi:hypothetical protein